MMSRTGTGFAPSTCGARLWPERRNRLLTKASTAVAKPIQNSGCVGGIAAEPPTQPTTAGPAPCPTAVATM